MGYGEFLSALQSKGCRIKPFLDFFGKLKYCFLKRIHDCSINANQPNRNASDSVAGKLNKIDLVSKRMNG